MQQPMVKFDTLFPLPITKVNYCLNRELKMLPLLEIKSFLKDCLAYPPQQIFAGKEVTAKSKKAEARIVDICEELFRYNKKTEKDIRYLAEFSTAFRDFEVAVKMREKFPVKQEYMAKVMANLAKTADAAINQMNVVYKKDQALWLYYQGFQVKPGALKNSIVQYAIDHFGEGSAKLIILYKEEMKNV